MWVKDTAARWVAVTGATTPAPMDLITFVPLGVRSFWTTLNEMPSSHYVRRMMVARLYLKPFSRYRQKTTLASAPTPQTSKFQFLANFYKFGIIFHVF